MSISTFRRRISEIQFLNDWHGGIAQGVLHPCHSFIQIFYYLNAKLTVV